MSEQIVTARVRLEVDIKASGCWSGDATMEQVTKQAIESAQNIIRGVGVRESRAITIIGKPVVTMVTAIENKR